MRGKRPVRPGFTLVELLVVMFIILLVSVVALPTVLSAYGERGIREAARLVQASIAGARDEAIHANAPRGIRFGADPTLPGMASRLVPIGPGPDYSEGLLTATDPATLPAGFVLPYPCLMVEQAPRAADGRPAEATSWPQNIRVGDRLRIGTGPWLTVVGPVDPATTTEEGFVANVQPLARPDPVAGQVRVDYLWLVNGQDDDDDGFADDGWDGVDNDADGTTDELDEWEIERWPQAPVASSPYTIRRRPVPSHALRAIALPASVVIDTKDTPPEFLVDPSGAVTLTGPYGVPSRIGLKDHEIKIHLIERGVGTNEAWVVLNTRTGHVEAEVGAP